MQATQALQRGGKSFPLPLPPKKYQTKSTRKAVVRLRIQTTGTRDFLHHTIVAAPSNLRSTGVPLEKLAEWDPIPQHRTLPNGLEYAGRVATRLEKRVEWNPERILWWLNNGAEPTTRVVWMLEKGGLLTPGEHPYYNGVPLPFSGKHFTGHWPEYDPKHTSNLQNVSVVGTEYVISPEDAALNARLDETRLATEAYEGRLKRLAELERELKRVQNYREQPFLERLDEAERIEKVVRMTGKFERRGVEQMMRERIEEGERYGLREEGVVKEEMKILRKMIRQDEVLNGVKEEKRKSHEAMLARDQAAKAEKEAKAA